MAGLWVRTVVVSVALAMACGGHVDRGEDFGDAPSGGGSSGGTSGVCSPTECECPNGLTGWTECPSGECACAQCTDVVPAAGPFSIEACGGEPFGIWKATKTEVSGYELHLSNSSGDAVTCKGGVESVSGGQYLVEFADGGVGKILRWEPDAVVLFETSCLEGAGAYCEYFHEYECEPLDCGLCRCSFEGSTLVSDMTWAREGTTLTIETSEGVESLEYCATDAGMVHVNESGRLRDTLEKAYQRGVPEACDERTKATCQGGGCILGRCAGSGDCALVDDEHSCSLYDDCSWESECSGKANASCDFENYARGVPGCELLPGTPTCVGTAEACDDQPDCAAAGCYLGVACVGGKHECGSWDTEIPGCVCSGGDCVGTFQCSDIDTSADCALAGRDDACRWTKQACVGTPIACKELTADQCQRTSGCSLQAE